METSPVGKAMEDIRADFNDIAETRLIFDLINSRETPVGIIQALSELKACNNDISAKLDNIQSLIIRLAVDVPSTQAALVTLLQAVMHCTDKDVHEGIWGTFGMSEGDLHSSLMHDDEKAAEYANINCFEAQLWRAMGSDVEDYLYSAPIMNFSRSIEQESPKVEFQTMDGEVGAACLWMIHGSERMWKLTSNADRDGGGKDWRGDLWKGGQGYSLERWKLWKKRFQDVVDGKVEKIGAETKRLAVAAVTNMNGVEAARQ